MENNGQQQTTQQTQLNWLDQELAEQKTEKKFEELPSLTLEENKVYEVTIDFSKPFESWLDQDNGTRKKIIPVLYAGVKYNFWLNVKNPLWNSLLTGGKAGKTQFKVMRTGQKKATRYTLVQ